MRPINVVLAHHDPAVARLLAESLRPRFHKVVTTTSLSQAETEIARVRASFVVADLELLSYDDLQKLCSEFPATAVACVHRLADEQMWLQSLSAGAVDCCQSEDVRGLVRASERWTTPVPTAA